MIPETTIDQIRQATDIAQVVSSYIRLKKRGRNFLGLCPFHTEKTPSFNVSPEKQIFHCFGCGKGGNVFTFLMEHEKMSFVEAVKFLARQANIVIKEDARSDYRREQFERLNYACLTAIEFFQQTLKSPRYAKVLSSYLKEKRKISDEAIEYFQLGLAGEEWDELIKFASAKDLSIDDLNGAGLVSRSDKTGNYYDRFRQRLMIPIYNLSGKPIAFGGRTLKKGEYAKYVNSPETPLYIKGNVLYNLDKAKQETRDSKQVYVVEGYFDVISLWQAGIKNVVASSGTAFTAQQARLLARFAEEVYLFFDADSAGRKAALRSVDVLYDAGLEVKVIIPPEGEDPDSIARENGREQIELLTEQAQDFITFRLHDVNLSTTGIIGKEKLVKEFSALAGKIADPTRRSLFLTAAGEALGVSPELIKLSEKTERADAKPQPKPKHDPAEVEFLALLFHNPNSIDSVFEKISPDDFDSRELSRLYSAIADQYHQQEKVDATKLIDIVRDAEFASLISLVASHEFAADTVDRELAKLIQIKLAAKRKRIRAKLTKQLAEAEATGDKEKATMLLEEIKSYQ